MSTDAFMALQCFSQRNRSRALNQKHLSCWRQTASLPSVIHSSAVIALSIFNISFLNCTILLTISTVIGTTLPFLDIVQLLSNSTSVQKHNEERKGVSTTWVMIRNPSVSQHRALLSFGTYTFDPSCEISFCVVVLLPTSV